MGAYETRIASRYPFAKISRNRQPQPVDGQHAPHVGEARPCASMSAVQTWDPVQLGVSIRQAARQAEPALVVRHSAPTPHSPTSLPQASPSCFAVIGARTLMQSGPIGSVPLSTSTSAQVVPETQLELVLSSGLQANVHCRVD
jgi:hypothetical protein